MTEILSQIDTILQTVRRQTGVPGLALCVERDGQRWFAASGAARAGSTLPIARQARFDVSCLMKFFLSVTALKLKAQGRLDLLSDVSALLPELGEKRGIRPIHLMSHSSGYHGLDITDMGVRWNSKWDGFAARFGQARQHFVPGTTFNYEHSEHVVLGEALRRRLGAGPAALVHNMLLSPAGVRLRDASAGEAGICAHVFSPQRGAYMPTKLPPFGAFWEASLPAMTITLDDVVSAVRASFADPALTPDIYAPLVELPAMARSENRAELPPQRFSASCGLYDDGILGHNGSMFGQTMGFRVDPRTGAVAAVGVNAYSAHARDTALRQVLTMLAGERLTISIDDKQPLSHAWEDISTDLAPDDIAGRYLGSYLGEVAVAHEDDNFLVTVGPAGSRQSSFKIVAGGGRYTMESRMPVALRFKKALDGSAVLFLGVHAYKQITPEAKSNRNGQVAYG